MSKYRNMDISKRGISALEIVIVIAIASVLTAVVLTSFRGFRIGQALNSTTIQTVNLLRDAHSRTVASLSDTEYGVHVGTSDVALFTGSVYSPNAPDNIVIAFSQNVATQSISLNGGGNDVVFKRLSGDSDTYGSITLVSTDDASKTKIITISQHGIIESQ